jgi:hypothetical protein
MASWGFLTNHARVLLCIARDPGARLRDIAASLGITERSAHGIVTDLAEAGYLIRQKDGRRNRYRIQAHLPVPEPGGHALVLPVNSAEEASQKGPPARAPSSPARRNGAGPWRPRTATRRQSLRPSPVPVLFQARIVLPGAPSRLGTKVPVAE